jgi:PAS domain S-box-containing protein
VTCAIIVGIGQSMRSGRHRAQLRGEVLRVTLRSIGDAVIATDTDARVTYFNAVAESLTGWTYDEAHGQPIENVFRILREDDRQPAQNPVARVLREGAVAGLANHTILVARDGTERSIDDSAAPIRDETGAITGCVLVFRDISARRRLERDEYARMLDARLLASIVESSEDAIVSKSLGGMIQTWNAAAERVFGYTAEEAVGRHISLIIPPERIAEEEQIIATLRAGQRVEHFETERLRKDGQKIHVSLTVSPVKANDGRVIGASKIARDVTDRRRLEDSIRKLAVNLAEVDRRKNEFLATLSHELRNPLAPMRNMLEVMKRSAGDSEALQPAIETLERQLGQLVRLVDDLLDLNRITYNRLELRKTNVELASVIHQAVQSQRTFAESAGHELEVKLPVVPIHLHADPVRLTQVFGNLLNNACKYTSPRGRIRVTAELEGSDAVITVEDTGVGLPSDKLDSIFDMFTQIDRSLERSQGGLGIGLTLVKRLVEMHGGTVEARSAGEGHGSEFIVRLPALAQPSSELVTPPPIAAEPVQGRRILVVDDNRDAATSLSMLLQITGNETYMAHDGAEALEAAQEHRPEVMLLDLGLPIMNGYEVCRRVREQPWGREMVLIALTGWGQEEDRRRSSEVGFDAHMVKPVEYDALTSLLDSLR